MEFWNGLELPMRLHIWIISHLNYAFELHFWTTHLNYTLKLHFWLTHLTFDSNEVFRYEDHAHANAENSWGFDAISSLYAEDSREPSGKFVFKFQNKPRKGKKNRLSSLRLHITHMTAYLNNFTFEQRILTALFEPHIWTTHWNCTFDWRIWPSYLNYTFRLHIWIAHLFTTVPAV